MKNIFLFGASTLLAAALLVGFGGLVGSTGKTASLSVASPSALQASVPLFSVSASGADVTSLEANGIIGSVDSSAAFTSGANSTVNGNVTAVAGVTIGDSARVNGSVRSGAAFTSGANSIVSGNVRAVGDVNLGDHSRILGTVFSGTGVINYGDGAVVGH